MNARRATHQPTTTPRLRVRWGRIAGASAVAVAGAGLIVAAWYTIPGKEPAIPDTSGGIGLCAAAYSNDCAAYYGAVIEPVAVTTPAPADDAVSSIDVAGDTYDRDADASQGGTPDAAEPAPVEPAPASENGTLDDGEIADGPVTEYAEGTLICGTAATVAIDTDIHGNEWAYCEPR